MNISIAPLDYDSGDIFISSIEKRLADNSTASEKEIEAINRFLKKSGMCTKKIRTKEPKVPLGAKQDVPINAVSGYKYPVQRSPGDVMAMFIRQGLIGQFAGKGEWSSIGRFIRNGESPIHSRYAPYGRMDAQGERVVINLYAYEQTEAI